MSTATIARRDVWNMGRLMESINSSDSPRRISDQDWPALEERVERVSKLSLDMSTGRREERHGICPTPPTASLSPTSDSGNEDPPELWNERELSLHCNWADDSIIGADDGQPNGLLSSASSNNGSYEQLEGSLGLISGNTTALSLESPEDLLLSLTPLPQNQKPSKGSKKKWVPLSLPDCLPQLTPCTSRREPNKAQPIKIKKRESIPHLPVPQNLVDETTPAPAVSKKIERSRAGRNRIKTRKYRSTFASVSVMSLDSSSYVPEFIDFNMARPRHFSATEFIMPYFGPNSEFYQPSLIDEKVIAGMLQTQLEYYFSEENLSRDFYLRRKMDSKGYLPIHLIASFQRVQFLTNDFQLVVQAIEASSKLEMMDGCVRTAKDPLLWPIIDSVSLSPVALMPPSPITLPPSDPFDL